MLSSVVPSSSRSFSVLASLFRNRSLPLPTAAAAAPGAPGLFQLPNLHAPQDFYRLTAEVKRECDALKHNRMHLDEISNAICSVIDAAELCRNVHPDEGYRNAASECFTDLSDFIQNLNADVDLYRALVTVTENAPLMRSFTEEQRRMGILLRKEFERDGIHLSNQGRKQVIVLQNDITQLSMEFQRTMFTAREYIEVPEKLLRPLPHGVLSVCERKLTNPSVFRVPTDLHVMNTILKWIGDPKIRKDMYMTANACAQSNLSTLDELRRKRHELAQLLGFETYAHFATSDRLVGSPEAVEKFIANISNQLMQNAQGEKQLLLAAKQRLEGRGATEVFMWDIPYYMGMLKAQKYRIDSRVIASYFPLERCLEGLHVLCSSLFGMELKSLPMGKSESWDSEVRKLALTKNGETLGYIYFDLYPRRNKYTNAAHFTIRCGKRLAGEDKYQKPIVALVCNFSKPAPYSPSLLTHSEVETLFHEFGHAMHSLLSRTEFQHLSGTRAQLDFVETPSHLFEYFAWDYRFVREFARHYETNEPIPHDMMVGLKMSKNMFAAMDTQTQCLYSLLDLKIFSEQPLPYDPSTTTEILKQLQNVSTLVPHVDGTFWHTRFGHLIGYGAGYYSYLYSRMFASDIWHACFSDNPINADAGDKLYKELMIHGGAKDPNEMLLTMIGRKPTPQSYLQELGVSA
uniref:Peptidase M3A/M3B catalytic domain-containing protein n=1 Tax=Globisporangium ultimum (strain ATCC 200006 / CBS 805.95 / DAOM BR144) TaxID=431595 RepID=K3X1H8_GLOUD